MTNKEIIATLDKLAESIEALRAEVQNNSKTTTSKKSSKSSKKSSTVSSTPSQEVVSKKDPSDGHFHIKGLSIWLVYKNPEDEGAYMFNRISKGIKHSIKNHGAKWEGDYDNKIWKWTFKDQAHLDSFLKDQREQAWKKRG